MRKAQISYDMRTDDEFDRSYMHPEDRDYADGGEKCATCGCLNCKHEYKDNKED
jgi:hypothetical protein